MQTAVIKKFLNTPTTSFRKHFTFSFKPLRVLTVHKRTKRRRKHLVKELRAILKGKGEGRVTFAINNISHSEAPWVKKVILGYFSTSKAIVQLWNYIFHFQWFLVNSVILRWIFFVRLNLFKLLVLLWSYEKKYFDFDCLFLKFFIHFLHNN